MAIEDAYVLAGLLSRPECNSDNVEAFLDAYEAVRRPRSQKQLMHACETGEVSRGEVQVDVVCRTDDDALQMFDWSTEKWGSDTGAIAKEMLTRTDWIWDHDIRDSLAEAVDELKKRGVVVG